MVGVLLYVVLLVWAGELAGGLLGSNDFSGQVRLGLA
jgi:hypothetical protein